MVQGGYIPSKANALLNGKRRLGVPITSNLLQQRIQPVKLVPIQKFNLLLNLCLNGFQPGNVEFGGSVFQLLQPFGGKIVLLSDLDILIHRPAEFFKLSSGQQLPGFRQADPVVGGEAPIPAFNIGLNLPLGIGEHFFKALKVFITLIVGAFFQNGEPAPPIIRIFHRASPLS